MKLVCMNVKKNKQTNKKTTCQNYYSVRSGYLSELSFKENKII